MISHSRLGSNLIVFSKRRLKHTTLLKHNLRLNNKKRNELKSKDSPSMIYIRFIMFFSFLFLIIWGVSSQKENIFHDLYENISENRIYFPIKIMSLIDMTSHLKLDEYK